MSDGINRVLCMECEGTGEFAGNTCDGCGGKGVHRLKSGQPSNGWPNRPAGKRPEAK
jgi:hypothetical protein